MRLRGAFADLHGRRVDIRIEPTAVTAEEWIEIGGEGVKWSDDPCRTQHSYNDQFDTLMRESCTIGLLSLSGLTDLYSAGPLGHRVTVERAGELLFLGYVEPQIYTQPYTDRYDKIEINCIDALSALQHTVWRNVTSAGVDYSTERSAAGHATLGDILREVFGKCAPGIEVESDGSRQIGGADALEAITVDTAIFFGDDEEDTWTDSDVADAVLTYLNLRAALDGGKIRIYSPDKLGSGVKVDIGDGKTWGRSHNIDIGESYNRLSLTSERDAVEEAVGDPLDGDEAKPVYDGRQLWCSEYAAYTAPDFLSAMGDESLGIEHKGWRKDHYLRVMTSARWKFGGTATRAGYSGDYYAAAVVPGADPQEYAANKLQDGKGAMLIEVTTGTQQFEKGDNSIPSDTQTASYLVIGVGGDGDDSQTAADGFTSDLLFCSPRAVFTGDGASLSPADEETTRYLVIGGKIRLNPRHIPKETYRRIWDYYQHDKGSLKLQHPEMEDYDTASETADGVTKGKRYYTRRYWHADTPKATPTEIACGVDYGLFPVEDDEYFQELEYDYHAVGDSTDRMLKLPVLACMLVVGDKCVVETTTDGTTASYEWRAYKTPEECGGNLDTYYAQSFSVGIDPKIGDKIIGQEHDITNNLHYSLGLDASGTAIPVRRSDNVSGEVRFVILGPYNMIWNKVTRKHPTWFRHTSWQSDFIPLLSHVSAIWVKDFSVRIVSDNAGDSFEDGDIVYTSDTATDFVNRKDDLTFRICSDLTAAERKALKVPDAVCRNMATERATGKGVLSIVDAVRGTGGKPERLYLDWHWHKASRARLTLTHGLRDADGNVGRWVRYTHQAMPGRAFAVDGISRDLWAGSASVRMTEI